MTRYANPAMMGAMSAAPGKSTTRGGKPPLTMGPATLPTGAGGFYSPPAPSLGIAGVGAMPGMMDPRKRQAQAVQKTVPTQAAPANGGNMLLNMSPQLRQLLARGFY